MPLFVLVFGTALWACGGFFGTLFQIQRGEARIEKLLRLAQNHRVPLLLGGLASALVALAIAGFSLRSLAEMQGPPMVLGLIGPFALVAGASFAAVIAASRAES